ncbi:hypothetical protein DFH11DRAFT_1631715 [Phellopilus nigrolimitatus]|nr:hypothetical protein DFH11DRAFT_1631715 [Phellopilus nigrolimitatus]
MPDDSMSPRPEGLAFESSIAHRVLRVCEIQDRIFSFNEQGDAVQCARVCQGWKDVALNHIWHTVYGVKPLFELLAPLVLSSDKSSDIVGLKYTRKIQPHDWLHFSEFAKRVKLLKIESSGEPFTNPLASVFVEVLRSRPETSILPNLTNLRLEVDSETSLLQYAVLFIHSKLRILFFRIILKQSNAPDVELFLNEVAARASNVQTLIANFTPSEFTRIESTFAHFLVRQESLVTLWLRRGTLTTVVLNASSCLPHLKQLSLLPANKRTDADTVQSISCEGGCEGQRFPSIRYIGLQSRLVSIASLVSAQRNFSQLLSLKIDIVSHNDADDLKKCLEVISTTCKALRILSFARSVDIGDRPAVLDQEKATITMATLMPMTLLPWLKNFRLTCTQPITISNDDLVDLLSRCSSLTTLSLNPEPVGLKEAHDKNMPSLAVLHRIAQCRPMLKTLSMCLNASGNDMLPLGIEISFQTLQTLSLGRSPIKNVDRVALYLSQVLPSSCTIETSDRSAAGWSRVKKKLPLFVDFRLEERRRIRDLEEEVRILRDRLLSASAMRGSLTPLETDSEEASTQETSSGDAMDEAKAEGSLTSGPNLEESADMTDATLICVKQEPDL